MSLTPSYTTKVEINGVWVSKLSQPFLNVMALYGPHVDKSEMFKMAESLGVASSMLIAYRLNGTLHPVILSSDYSIAFPTLEPEGLYFDVMHDMESQLFHDSIAVDDSAFNKRRKKRQSNRDDDETSTRQP